MSAYLTKFLEDQSGSSFMEYALLAAFVSVMIAGSLSFMGSNTSAAFATASGDVEQAAYETCVKTAETSYICQHP